MLSLVLQFDQYDTCIVPVNNKYSLCLTYLPSMQSICCYAPLLNGFPSGSDNLLKLYEMTLRGTMLGQATGIGIAVKKEQILIYRYIGMNKVKSLELIPELLYY